MRRVKYPFVASAADEISVVKGQIVELVHSDQGWSLIRCTSHTNSGYIPSGYLDDSAYAEDKHSPTVKDKSLNAKAMLEREQNALERSSELKAATEHEQTTKTGKNRNVKLRNGNKGYKHIPNTQRQDVVKAAISDYYPETVTFSSIQERNIASRTGRKSRAHQSDPIQSAHPSEGHEHDGSVDDYKPRHYNNKTTHNLKTRSNYSDDSSQVAQRTDQALGRASNQKSATEITAEPKSSEKRRSSVSCDRLTSPASNAAPMTSTTSTLRDRLAVSSQISSSVRRRRNSSVIIPSHHGPDLHQNSTSNNLNQSRETKRNETRRYSLSCIPTDQHAPHVLSTSTTSKTGQSSYSPHTARVRQRRKSTVDELMAQRMNLLPRQSDHTPYRANKTTGTALRQRRNTVACLPATQDFLKLAENIPPAQPTASPTLSSSSVAARSITKRASMKPQLSMCREMSQDTLSIRTRSDSTTSERTTPQSSLDIEEEQIRGQYLVVYSHKGSQLRDDTEITITKGEMVTVFSREDDEMQWVWIENDQMEEGCVPFSCLIKLTDDDSDSDDQ